MKVFLPVFLLHKLFFEVSTRFRFVGAYVLCGLTKGILVDPSTLRVCGARKSLGMCCCVRSGIQEVEFWPGM